MKNGNQHTMKAPTTIARVFPALNSRRKWTVVSELRLAVAATAFACDNAILNTIPLK